MTRSRPNRCAQALLAAALLCLQPLHVAQAFDFSDVVKDAEQLAGKAFQKPESNLPKELRSLSDDQYWNIRFKPDKAYWRGTRLPFELEFFPEGRQYDLPVKINEITAEGVRAIKFDPDLFDYGAIKIDPNSLRGLGFAGFHVRYAANDSDVKQEALAFHGASYVRAPGEEGAYGLYARGLAVDTGLPSGEEFPRFVEFWIEHPSSSAKQLVIYALLDSARVAGAYRFVFTPGSETSLEVTARLYLRAPVGKFGIAPLASMYLFGSNQRPNGDDYRPQVHDSDGLSISSATGEWFWRPLVNPKRLLVSSFALTNPRGFGLMQRDREFGQYEDLQTRYDLRPSAWVEPKGEWGAGRVELVQIPLPDETNNNIIAYWVPDKVPPPREPFDVAYRVIWQTEPDTRPEHAWVAQTLRGRRPTRNPDGSIGFVIDYEGAELKKLPPDAKVEGVVKTDSNAEVLQHSTYRNDATGGWRVALRVRRLDDNKPVELRAYLRVAGNMLSESWNYLLPPG